MDNPDLSNSPDRRGNPSSLGLFDQPTPFFSPVPARPNEGDGGNGYPGPTTKHSPQVFHHKSPGSPFWSNLDSLDNKGMSSPAPGADRSPLLFSPVAHIAPGQPSVALSRSPKLNRFGVLSSTAKIPATNDGDLPTMSQNISVDVDAGTLLRPVPDGRATQGRKLRANLTLSEEIAFEMLDGRTLKEVSRTSSQLSRKRPPLPPVASGPSRVPPPTAKDGKRKHCFCKKSQCLKLYCECFAANVFCDGCKCQCCMNTAEHSKERQEAIEATLERNPNAFAPKIVDKTSQHIKGCHCKKSACRKKYCECYQARVACSSRCKCQGCRNTGGPGDVGGDDAALSEDVSPLNKRLRPTALDYSPNGAVRSEGGVVSGVAGGVLVGGPGLDTLGLSAGPLVASADDNQLAMDHLAGSAFELGPDAGQGGTLDVLMIPEQGTLGGLYSHLHH